MTLLVLIRMNFMIIGKMFPGEISLNFKPHLLLVNLVNGFKLELVYVSSIVTISSNLTHLHGFQLLVLLVHRNHFFLYQQNKSSKSKVRFRRVNNCCKKVIEAAKLAYMLNKTKIITFQKHCSQDFWRIANSVFHKGKFNSQKVVSSVSDKAKLFAKNFFKNSS